MDNPSRFAYQTKEELQLVIDKLERALNGRLIAEPDYQLKELMEEQIVKLKIRMNEPSRR